MYSNRELVESGAAWLDEVKPGWEGLIDLAKFDISDGNACICGQVFMDEFLSAADPNVYTPYSHALDMFHDRVITNYDPGVTDSYSPFCPTGDESASNLAEEWVYFIKERYSNGTLSGNA